jgi:betaine-aldehyde dehydrogenase
VTGDGQQFIAGKRRHGTTADLNRVINPASGEVLDIGALGGPEDVDEAVGAASDAFPAWSRSTPAERSELLLRWADELEAHSDELADSCSNRARTPAAA